MKLRYPILLFALTLVMAPPARAQSGINLSWSDCGTSGLATANFACNTNAGSHTLFVSFVTGLPLPQFNGVEVVIDVLFNQPTNPAWWSVEMGGCRANGIVTSVDYAAGPFTCADPWQSSGVALGVYQPATPSTDRMRIRGTAARPTTIALDGTTEYHAMKLTITHAKTVGTGACAGCNYAACLLLQGVTLTQPTGVGNYLITQPKDNSLVGWQCPAFNGSPGPVCFACPVKSEKGTWGSVKGMYR